MKTVHLRPGRPRRFVAFLVLVAAMLAYVLWQSGTWGRPQPNGGTIPAQGAQGAQVAAPAPARPAARPRAAGQPSAVPQAAVPPSRKSPSGTSPSGTSPSGTSPSGTSPTGVSPSGGQQAAAPPDFFEMARLDRQRARSEAIDLLRSVADDPQAAASARTGADQKLIAMATRIREASQAEDLLRAKGYRDALVMLETGGATAIVRARSLTATDVARIAAAVSRATGVTPENINVLSEE